MVCAQFAYVCEPYVCINVYAYVYVLLLPIDKEALVAWL